MRVKTCKTNSSSEVCLLPLPHWVLVAIKMLLGETKVHNKNLLKVLAEYKVGSLHISVNEISVMNLLNGFQHLN